MENNNRKFLPNDIMLMAVGAVGVLAGLLAISSYFILSIDKANYGQVVNLKNNISVTKDQILAMVKNESILSPVSRKVIGSAIIGEKVKRYGFSQDEINKVIEALNKY